MDYKLTNKGIDDPTPVKLADAPFDELTLIGCLTLALSIQRQEGRKKFKIELDLTDADPNRLSAIAVALEEFDFGPDDMGGNNILRFPQ